jgi:hypothetical protein
MHMRFYGTLKLNGHTVGKGFGNNKKQVKYVTARIALQNLAPTLLKEWEESDPRRKTTADLDAQAYNEVDQIMSTPQPVTF